MEIQIAPKNKLIEISLAGLLNSSANGVIISQPTKEKKIITEEAPTEDHPFGTNGVKELNFTYGIETITATTIKSEIIQITNTLTFDDSSIPFICKSKEVIKINAAIPITLRLLIGKHIQYNGHLLKQ